MDVVIRWFPLLALLAACGRLEFSQLPLSDGGTSPDSAPLHCVAWNPFGAPVDIGHGSAAAHWAGSVTTDEQILFFADYTTANSNDLWMATRSALADNFTGDTRIAALSTTAGEFTPVSPDGLVLYYTTNGAGDFKIMTATRASLTDPFGAPTLVSELDSSSDDSPGWVSADGLRIYISSMRTTAGALFFAERADVAQPFGTPVLLAELDSSASEAHPSLSADELELFFASKRATATYDIYRAHRASRELPFDPPVPVTELNTPDDDTLPCLSADGARLYFNYNTLLAGGKPSDLWMAERTCATYAPE